MEMSDNKVALITGASRGIGKACALELARRGCDIAVNYHSNTEQAEKTVAEIEALGRKAVAYQADTADLSAVKQMFRAAVKDFGKLDILVNNAGVVDDHCAQQAALKMLSKKQGVIINISSVSSVLAVEGQSVYSATKGAVNSMTAVMAKELAPKGIRVNAVAPGFIATEMLDSIPDDLRQQYLKTIPMKRFGSADEIARTVCALCSDDFSYLTGQTIILDGGLSL